MKKFDVLILGGGASGLMCASWLNANSSLDVGIIEANTNLAQKLKISGGGKCNITNVDVSKEYFLGDDSFVDDVLKEFSKDDLLRFLKKHGLNPVIRKKRYYFCPKSSDEIINILKKESSKTKMIMGEKILHVRDNFIVKTDKNSYQATHLVVATGGESYKSIGATDIGLKIAKDYKHEIKPFYPALVGLTLQPKQFWMKELSGISLHVKIKIEDRVIDEDMLFAHKGISGLAVLSASLYWHKGDIEIDFLPELHVRDIIKSNKKNISTALMLPKRFSRLFLEAIELKDKPCNKLNKEEIERLCQIHSYSFAPSGNFGFSKAEVSRGGVISSEIESKSMQSKRVKNLYFIGEVLDVTGELGGYNFQWAFSSGVVCAKNLVNICK
jgi:predicted Rossmann fold flavoprotein